MQWDFVLPVIILQAVHPERRLIARNSRMSSSPALHLLLESTHVIFT